MTSMNPNAKNPNATKTKAATRAALAACMLMAVLLCWGCGAKSSPRAVATSDFAPARSVSNPSPESFDPVTQSTTQPVSPQDIRSRVKFGMTLADVRAIAGGRGDVIGGDTIPSQPMPGLKLSYYNSKDAVSFVFQRDDRGEWRVVQF